MSDPDAGYGNKGAGYSAHITETCGNEGAPEIITDFELRSAADNDWGKSTAVLERLVERDLAPRTMFADAGYPTPQSLIDAARLGVDLHAPVGRKGGDERFGLEAFVLAEDGTVAACPEGHVPLRHATRREPGCKEPELHAYFDGDTCRGCPRFESCPATGRATGQIHVRVEERIVARDMAIERQRSSKWWLTYAIRSGVEATMSELKRAHGLGRLRVRTGVRVAMRLALILTSCNIKRWLNGLPEPEATA